MPNQPRVLRLITWLPVGGIERRLVAVLPRLKARGFDVRLVCLREYGALADELGAAGVPVDLIALRSRLDPAGIWRLSSFMRRHRIDIVHAHMYRASVPGTIAARLAKVPVTFAHVHNVNTWESARQVHLDRFLCRWRTGVFCVSQAVRDDVCETLKLSPERAPLLYNGIDTDVFRPDDALRRMTRERLGVDAARTVFLVPARLHPQKNPVGVLRAFRDAMARGGFDPILLFAGAGPMEEELKREMATMGLTKNVRFLGRRDDMAELYNAADAMVLSSFKEGFSNAVVEALACGCPVIASDVGGNREAVSTPEVGWIHAAGDGETLANQIVAVCTEGAHLRARREACRQRGLRFSIERLVDETAEHYLEAIRKVRRK